MTTWNSASAFIWKSPLLSVLLACFVAGGLAGCESSSNVLGGGATAPEAALTPAPAAAGTSQVAKLQIAPIIGSPETVARDLQSQLTLAIERNRITVAKAPNVTSEYTLRGYIVASREKSGSKISYIWDITDPAGKRINRMTGEEFAPGAGKDPWSSVTPQVVQSIADKTAKQIASLLPGGSQSSAGIPIASNSSSVNASSSQASSGTAVATAAPPAPALATGATTQPAGLTGQATGQTTGSIDASGPINTLVPSVIGAPGDGSTSLTSAIQRELTKNGVALTSTASPKTYRVEGQVALGQTKDGKQPIQIDWSVVDPAGKKLGTVSQKNEVPQGSLDGAWGKTADAAAAAAAQGIIKLLPQPKAIN